MPSRPKAISPEAPSAATIGFRAGLAQIRAGILALEKETEGLLQEITKGVTI